MRIILLDHFESWGDEKLSVSEANGMLTFELQDGSEFTKKEIETNNNLHQVTLSTIKGDGGNGILYTICLHFWTKLFGNSDFAVRFLSVIMGMFAIIITYFISMQLFANKKLALLNMLLLAIHPQLISFSQECRTYSFALCFTLLASYLLIRMAQNKNFNNLSVVLYLILVIVSFLSHLSTVYIFGAHFIILLLIYKIEWRDWKKLLVLSIIPISILLIWMYSYGFEGLNILTSRNQNYTKLSILDPTNNFYMKTSLYSICAGWGQNLLIFYGNTILNIGIRILLLLPLISIPFILIYYGIKNMETENSKKINSLIILTISSLIYATILSLIAGHIISFQHLYSIFSTPYSILILSFSILIVSKLANSYLKYLLSTLILLQFSIMLFSTGLIYLGHDTHTKNSNYYYHLANEIEKTNIQYGNDIEITYKNIETAIEVNKYISKRSYNIVQRIDTASTNGQVSILLTKSSSRIILLN
ncbi:MAG: glycosyltransferase family 39 protein [Bacteroidia bacterium]